MTLADLPPQFQAQAKAALAAAPSRAKYRSQRVECGGYLFDSKWELHRYGELKRMEEQGLITDLQVHVSFGLHVRLHGNPDIWERIGSYEADFVYKREGITVVEDCKSTATQKLPLYRWKRAHFEVEYGITINEIMRGRRRRAKERR